MGPSKFSAVTHLVVFTSMQVLTYFDRAALSQFLAPITLAYNLSSTEQGLLGSIFTAGFTVAAPLLGYLGQKHPMQAIGGGLLVWCVANGCIALLGNEGDGWFVELLLCRVLGGVGEAGFCALAPLVIDGSAPEGRRGLFLGVYYMAIFMGQAIGFIGCGALAGALSEWKSLKFVFLAEGVLMLPLALLCVLAPGKFLTSGRADDDAPLTTRRSLARSTMLERPSIAERVSVRVSEALTVSLVERARSQIRTSQIGVVARPPPSLPEQLRMLASNSVFVFSVLGIAAYTFLVQGVGFWTPTFVQALLHMSQSDTGYLLGAITVFGGIGGAMTGSTLLDKLLSKEESTFSAPPGARLEAAAKITTGFSILALPCVVPLAFIAAKIPFFMLLLVAQFCLFATTTPGVVMILEGVPEEIRSTALGVEACALHVLGDLPSQFLVGVVASAVSGGAEQGPEYAKGLRTGVFFIACYYTTAVIYFAVAWHLAKMRRKQSPTSVVPPRLPPGGLETFQSTGDRDGSA